MSLDKVLVFAVEYYNADARNHFARSIIVPYNQGWEQAWQDAFKAAVKYEEDNSNYGYLLVGIKFIGYPLEQDSGKPPPESP